MIDFNSIPRNGTYNHFVKSRAVEAYQMIEGNKNFYTSHQKQILAMNRNNFPTDVDISWLPAAAETYQISPDIRDYIICDVPAVTVDIPNRNLQAFPYEEVSYFDPKHGRMIYETFVGKPSCKDHDNKVQENFDRAKGIILCASLQYVKPYGVWKIRLLQGFDRSKDQRLSHEIANRIRKYFSMGALVSAFVCPLCGGIESLTKLCPCGTQKGQIVQGSLKYSLCCDVVYIENSSVIEPADATAEGIIF